MVSTHDEYTALHIQLGGYRALALAGLSTCEDFAHRRMYANLIDGLKVRLEAIEAIRSIESRNGLDEWERQTLLEDKFDRLYGTIFVGGHLEIDNSTMEYKIDGGEWRSAYSGDCDGQTIDYPSEREMTSVELGPLAELIAEINAEDDIQISTSVIVYSWENNLDQKVGCSFQ